MAVSIKVTQFAAATSTGTQDITISGFGTPKAAIFVAGKCTANGTAANGYSFSVGATDGTRNRVNVTSSRDAAGTTDVTRIGDNDEVIVLTNDGTTTRIGEANFDSWITDGVRINWTIAPGSAYLINVILITGADVTAYVNHANVAASTVDVTAPAFQPDMLFLIAATDQIPFDGTGSNGGLGVAVRSPAAQFSISGADRNAVADSRVGTYSTAVYGASQADHVASTPSKTATIQDFDANGFSINPGSSDWGNDSIIYLALKLDGVSIKAGTYTTATATGSHATTGVGFQPAFLMLGHAWNTALETNNPNIGISSGISATDGVNAYCMTYQAEQDQTSSDTQTMADNKIINQPHATGATANVATFSSFDSDGFTFSYSAANGTGRKDWYLAIEGAAGSTPQTKTLTLNALIQKQNVLATASLGALVQKQGITATASLDAQVMAEQLVTAALNALLKAERVTASTDLNALIQAAINQTLSLDSVIDLQMSHHWRFENGFTDSAGSWDLTAVNSPGFTQGAPNKKAGLDLIGASDQLAWSDNDFTGAPALTVTGWFKATGAATLYMLSVRSNPAIAANDIQLQIASVADGRIAISIETNDTTETFFSTATTEEYNTDEWTYLALVFDGSATNVKLYASKPPYSTLELWIDETTAGGTISEPAAGPGDIAIGGGRGATINTWNTVNSWDGELDDIRTYPGVLDSTELAAVRDEVQGSLLIPSLDALIQALATDTVNLDALIQAAAIATAQLDGLIKVEGATVTTDLGALLQATQSVTTDLDALLQARQTETTDLGALLLKALSVSTALDAVLIDAGVTTVTTNLDALIKALGLTVSTGFDAMVQTTASESAALDAMIQAQASLTASLTAVLKREGVTVSSSVDGLISAALTRSASLDALVQIRQALATSLDAVLVLGVNLVQASLDALIQARVTTSTGLDALILPFIRPEHVTYLTGVLRQVSNIRGTRIAQSALKGEIDDGD